MKVIKRNGSIQEFDINKVRTSILNSADDIGYELTESDLNFIYNEVQKVINKIRIDNSNTSSYELISIILDVLKSNGFKKIADSYMDFDR